MQQWRGNRTNREGGNTSGFTIEQDDAEAIASAPLSDHSRNFDPRGNIDWSGLYWNSSNASRDTRPLDGYGLSVRAN